MESLHTQDDRRSWRAQVGLVAAMKEPAFYPQPPTEVIHKETHISHVFLAGGLVYKIKKPVRFSFLDYSTLSQRSYFLSEELRLNRRLAPSVYLAIMPITVDGSGWHLGGDGPPAEYALVMRRLPERRMLPFLLETHQVTSGMMADLAEVLARFHAQAERITWTDASGYPKAVAGQWSENFDDFRSLLETSIEAEAVDLLKDFGVRFIDRHHDLLMQRARGGWIRDVHGDLHCEHVCFAPEGIEIFDCIEFSPAIRRCDLASEMAFLLMDLEIRGGGFAVQPLLARYRELLDDAEMPVLLPFYQSYRAVVRAKVHALRAGGMDREAARYFRFALRFTWDPMKPFVLMICGLTGSGKSTLARELGERLGMPVINSDAVRKGMAERSGREIVPFHAGIYTRAMTEKTYAKMARDAESAILSGSGAILDATFGQKAHRGKIIRLAEKHRVPLFLIHCVAPEATTRKRLDERALAGNDISDGRWEIYRQQSAAYQAIDEIPPGYRLELNTEPTVEELARMSERFLRSGGAPGASLA